MLSESVWILTKRRERVTISPLPFIRSLCVSFFFAVRMTRRFTLILLDRMRRNFFLARHLGLKCLTPLGGGAAMSTHQIPRESDRRRSSKRRHDERTCSRFRYNSSSAKREDVSGYSWGRRGIFFSNLPDGPTCWNVCRWWPIIRGIWLFIIRASRERMFLLVCSTK